MFKTYINANIEKNKFPTVSSFCYGIMLIVSVFAVALIALTAHKPEHYLELYLLPVSFIFLLVMNYYNKNKLFNNFGVLFIIVLEFIRLVISPIFLIWSNYLEVIILNVEQNTPSAIYLMLYETIFIGLALLVPIKKFNRKQYKENKYNKMIKRLHIVIGSYILLLIVLCCISPDILLAHRTFLGVFTDKSFSHLTLDSIISNFNGTTFRRYCLILSRFFITPFRLIFPAYLIIIIKYYKLKWGKWLSIAISIFPMLMVNDVIAQSIYFTAFLLLLTVNLYNMGFRTIVIIALLAVAMVFLYFLGRHIISSEKESFLVSLSRRFITYFSGLNIVSGEYNIPYLANKVQYCLYDFLKAIPFNKTLLGLDPTISFSTVFNHYNDVYGQIPPTVAMCNYYFGFACSPVYSVALAFCAKRFASKMQSRTSPLLRMADMFSAFILSLGIVMYNIEIACNIMVQIVLPIYIISWIVEYDSENYSLLLVRR